VKRDPARRNPTMRAERGRLMAGTHHHEGEFTGLETNSWIFIPKAP